MTLSLDNMRRFTMFILCLAVLISCKRERATWDIDFIGPVAFAEYNIADLLPDSVLVENDSDFLSIQFSQELINLKPDSLINIEDTLISNNYTLPPVIFSLPLAPGFAFPFSPGTLDLDPGDDVELKEASVCTGFININMINPFATPLIVTYALTDLTLNGESFTFVDTLSPAINSIPFQKEVSFDIADYDLNLTSGGPTSNELSQSLSLINSLSGDTVIVTQSDTVKFDLAISNLSLSYAKGYFGNFIISESDDFQLDNFIGLESNNLILDAASLAIKISNGIGADFRLSQTQYQVSNSNSGLLLNLENDELNQDLNIDRAIDLGSEPLYSTKEIMLNETNSNLLDILSLAPNSFDFDFAIEVNPLGNSSSSNDFIYKNDGVLIAADVDIPLCFGVDELVIQDTLNFNFEENESFTLQEGVLNINLENNMPFEIELDLSVLNISNEEITILANNQIISSCNYNNNDCTEPSMSELSYILTQDIVTTLKENGQLILSGNFSSLGSIKIKSDQYIKFNAVVEANILTGL